MMDPFKMVVFIVLFVCIAGVLKSYLDRSGRGAGIMGIMDELGLGDSWGDDPSKVGAHIKKIDELEKRVQVLERIVTSKNYDLKRKIDDLAES